MGQKGCQNNCQHLLDCQVAMCMVTASTLPTLHVLYPAASASDVLNRYQQHCTLHSLQALADMLVEVCKNPKSPGFNHYLFESVAALIKHGTAADPAQMSTYEATLFPAFQIVLSNDVQEFHPYVFQIFAQLIELSNPPLSAVGTAVPIPECQHGLGDDLFTSRQLAIYWLRQGCFTGQTTLMHLAPMSTTLWP